MDACCRWPRDDKVEKEELPEPWRAHREFPLGIEMVRLSRRGYIKMSLV